MKLCRTVLHCSLEEAKERISYQEFIEWQLEYELDPWGDDWKQASGIMASNLAPWSKEKVHAEAFIPGRTKDYFREMEIARLRALMERNEAAERERRNGDNR